MDKNSIISNVKKIREQALIDNRYSLFDFSCVRKCIEKDDIEIYALNSIYDIVSGWDELSKLDIETGKLLDRLEQNGDVTVGFHRTKLDLDGNDLEDIMENGLINYGHINAYGGTAVLSNLPPLSLTMTPLSGITGLVNLTGRYHDNNTTILAVFPSNIVDDELNTKNERNSDVYNIDNEKNPRIKPDYLIGALIKNSDGLDKFYTRDELIKGQYKNKNEIVK